MGGWLSGFSRKIGIIPNFLAEIWALRDHLIMCQNIQLIALEIKLDAKAIVDLLANSSYPNNDISSIVDNCKLLVS